MIAMQQSPWQRVIHGRTGEFRRVVALGMVAAGHVAAAKRYIMCGMGDRMGHADGSGYRVMPIRCGHKLCPRCGRYRGSQRVRHVMAHLEGGPHGPLWHLVFTQGAMRGEALTATRSRFEKMWGRMARRFAACGLVAALRSTHCTRSRGGGWHYHAHVFAEFAGSSEESERAVLELVTYWRETGKALFGYEFDVQFWRKIADAGEGIPRDENDQGEFWGDREDAVARAIQYVVHDVCQGVEAWRLEESKGCAQELAEVLRGAQLSRLYGHWKVTAEKRWGTTDGESTGVASLEVKSFDATTAVLGTMDDMLRSARMGVRSASEALKWLMERMSSASMVGRRLRREASFLGV